jgi:hypothetical protein
MSLDPAADSTLRTSDAEREHVVAALGLHLSVGRLTMSEFKIESTPPTPPERAVSSTPCWPTCQRRRHSRLHHRLDEIPWPVGGGRRGP